LRGGLGCLSARQHLGGLRLANQAAGSLSPRCSVAWHFRRACAGRFKMDKRELLYILLFFATAVMAAWVLHDAIALVVK
jgi:hypothetical protein